MSSAFIIVIIAYVRTLPKPINSGPWMLDPSVTYLNHGSFGARTETVFATQMRYKMELERSPVDFLDRHRNRIDFARISTASFLHADSSGLGFVVNATTGVSCILHSLQITEKDEILTTSLVYNGIRQLLRNHARKEGCTYRELDLMLPLSSSDAILKRVDAAISSRTTLLVIDHVSSASAIVFPIREIIALCRAKGIKVLVDGAHAPGMIDLHISELDPDWYVGNLHKWVCAPIGSAFIWTNKKYRESTHPVTISHWLDQGYTEEFDWQGTRDVSAWLAVVDAIGEGADIGWDRIRKHNHDMAVWVQQKLVSTWNIEPYTPIDGKLLGSMVTVQLPKTCPQSMEDCLQFRDQLFRNHRIEVPIFEFQGKGALRISCQTYTIPEQLYGLIDIIDNISRFV